MVRVGWLIAIAACGRLRFDEVGGGPNGPPGDGASVDVPVMLGDGRQDAACTKSFARVTTMANASSWLSFAWSGSEYLVVWGSTNGVEYARVDSAGVPGAPTLLDTIGNDSVVRWDGTTFGVAFPGRFGASNPKFDVYYTPIDASGSTGAQKRQTSSGTVAYFVSPSVGWSGANGAGFSVSFGDGAPFLGSPTSRSFISVSSAGNTTAGPVTIDPSITSGEGSSLAWNGIDFGLVYATGGAPALKFVRINSGGSLVVVATSPALAGPALLSSMVWSGSEYALAWGDGNRRDHVARLDATGAVIADVPLGADDNVGSAPTLAFDDSSRYGVAHIVGNADPSEVRVRQLATDGSTLAADVAVAINAGRPQIVWNGSSFAVAFLAGTPGNQDVYVAVLCP